ncbi:hypothetical protein ZWY2020_044016 [Hordeum vulgare]|nr:hypothetical protein ZWY2020_044016 [Hordeum vulgare]
MNGAGGGTTASSRPTHVCPCDAATPINVRLFPLLLSPDRASAVRAQLDRDVRARASIPCAACAPAPSMPSLLVDARCAVPWLVGLGFHVAICLLVDSVR